MRLNRWNCSTGVIEVSYPMTMTVDDVQDFKDQMAITFRILERTATNGQRQTGETTSESNIAEFRRDRNRRTNLAAEPMKAEPLKLYYPITTPRRE